MVSAVVYLRHESSWATIWEWGGSNNFFYSLNYTIFIDYKYNTIIFCTIYNQWLHEFVIIEGEGYPPPGSVTGVPIHNIIICLKHTEREMIVNTLLKLIIVRLRDAVDRSWNTLFKYIRHGLPRAVSSNNHVAKYFVENSWGSVK